MANVHNEFIKFEEAISVPDDMLEEMKQAMDKLQQNISTLLKNKRVLPSFEFNVHGSFIMKTMVKYFNKGFDIDFGIYFQHCPSISFKEIKKLLFNKLVGSYGYTGVIRDKCIRIDFNKLFHIDISIYHKTQDLEFFRLARESSWMPTNPTGFYQWFKNKTADKDQIIRLIKYFKYWASLNKMKMPSGMSLTTWTIENYFESERDDVALLETAKQIFDNVIKGVYCRNPVSPFDNLVYSLQKRHRKNFIKSLKQLIEDGEIAKLEKSEYRSVNCWGYQFGDLFTSMIK